MILENLFMIPFTGRLQSLKTHMPYMYSKKVHSLWIDGLKQRLQTYVTDINKRTIVNKFVGSQILSFST